MTMADTIAVMNGGRIEQLGGPTELYESPVSTFVANFLGQSNLLDATVAGTTGEDLLLDVHGHRLSVPRGRTVAQAGQVRVGVRPEKVHLALSGSEPAGERTNVLPGGIVSDASFTGVSTQYLVRMPWGPELTVFVQNVGAASVLAVGEKVDLQWDAAHTFGVDGAGDPTAGVIYDEGAEPVPVR